MHLISKISLILFSFAVSYSQVGTWEKLSTLTEIRSMLPLQDEVILATDGGLIRLSKSSGLFSYGYQGETNENLDLSSLHVDSDNLLWLGARSPGPIVEVLDLSSFNYQSVEFVDLDESNSFIQVGDSVYATYHDGLEGGLLLYRKDSDGIKYLDVFNNFPGQSDMDLGLADEVGFTSGKLFFRTNSEIVWVELDGRNLKDPVNWNVDKLSSSDAEISSIIVLKDSLLLSAGENVISYDFESFTTIASANAEIVDMIEEPNNPEIIILATNSGLVSLDLVENLEVTIEDISNITSIEAFNDEIWIASSTGFLGVFQPQGYTEYSANRPRDHLFTSMIVDDAGQLVGSARNGFSIYSSNGWKTIKSGNFDSEFDEDSYNWHEMITETLDYRGNSVVEDMVIDEAGNIYSSIQGQGVLKLDNTNPVDSRFFSPLDGTIEPTYDSDTYTLPGQLAVDSRQNVWASTKFVQEGGAVLSILTPDDSVYQIHQYQGGLTSRSVKSVAIDQNDMVWLGSQVRTELQASGGIDFLNILDDDISEGMEIQVSHLGTDSPLASNEILQLEIDNDNVLWILSSAGVQSMVLPDTWLSSSELKNHASLYMTPKESDFYYYWQLTDYNVTGIEIDQRGNHWFLSDNAGVHVLQENGRWINGGYGYNTSNSGLLDNEIYSAAFNAETGQTYFSTPKGVSVLNTPFANPKETYSSIHVYPQPFNPDIHDQVIIQGLMDNSSVRILTLQGSLVRELNYLEENVQGYEAQWDGRDAAGDKVGSGVYILFLFNDEGAAASHKLAVLR